MFEKPRVLSTEILVLALVALGLWHGLATLLYQFLSPESLNSLVTRQTDKGLQYFLYASAIAVPFLVQTILRRQVLSSQLVTGLLYVGTVIGFFASLAEFGPYAFLAALIFVALSPRIFREVSLPPAATLVVSMGLAIALYGRHRILISDHVEDGPRLATLAAWLQGLHPYRDVVLQYGVLQEVLKAKIAFWFAPIAYSSLLAVNLWLSIGGTVLCFLLIRELVKNQWIAVLWALWVAWRLEWSLPDRMVLGLLTAYLLARSLRSAQSKRWEIAAGFCASCSLLYSFEVGLLVFMGVALWLVLERWQKTFWRPLRPLVLGACLPLLGALLYTASQGGWIDFLRDALERLLYGVGPWSEGLSSPFFAFGLWASDPVIRQHLAYHAIPFTALGLLTSNLSQRSEPRASAQNLLASLAYVTFLVYLSRSDHRHGTIAMSFQWVLLAVLLDKAVEFCIHRPASDVARRTGFLWAAILVLPVMATLTGRDPWISFMVNGLTFPKGQVPLSPVSRLGRAQITESEELRLQKWVTALQTAVPPGESYFDFSKNAYLHFFADRRSATRATITDALCGPRAVQRALRELETSAPSAVLVKEEGGQIEARSDLAPIKNYIQTHYWPQTREGGLALWVKSSKSR